MVDVTKLSEALDALEAKVRNAEQALRDQQAAGAGGDDQAQIDALTARVEALGGELPDAAPVDVPAVDAVPSPAPDAPADTPGPVTTPTDVEASPVPRSNDPVIAEASSTTVWTPPGS